MVRVPDNFGRSLIEIYSGDEFKARVRDIAFSGDGVEALAQARDQGRPVILITGHFGNYDAPRAALIANGYPVGGLYNPMSNAFFNDQYVAAIGGLGKPVFERSRKGLAEMVRFLKSRRHRRHGRRSLHEATACRSISSATLPIPRFPAAEMAIKYDALVVPIYGIRQPDGLSFDIRVEAPIPHGDPVAMTQAMNDSLSALVRQHMDQWFWIHRRWKEPPQD